MKAPPQPGRFYATEVVCRDTKNCRENLPGWGENNDKIEINLLLQRYGRFLEHHLGRSTNP